MTNSHARSPAHRTNGSKRQLINWAAVTAISGVVGAAIALLGTSAANHWWLFKQPYSLQIGPPPSSTIPRCATIEGKMLIPSGYSIWVAQQGAGEQKLYDLKQATSVSATSWQVNMTVGNSSDRNASFTIYAFAVDSETSQLLNNIHTLPDKSYFYLNGPPAQLLSSARPMTRNGQDDNPCT
jgi:hypothetical protein